MSITKKDRVPDYVLLGNETSVKAVFLEQLLMAQIVQKFL